MAKYLTGSGGGSRAEPPGGAGGREAKRPNIRLEAAEAEGRREADGRPTGGPKGGLDDRPKRRDQMAKYLAEGGRGTANGQIFG